MKVSNSEHDELPYMYRPELAQSLPNLPLMIQLAVTQLAMWHVVPLHETGMLGFKFSLPYLLFPCQLLVSLLSVILPAPKATHSRWKTSRSLGQVPYVLTVMLE